MRGTAAVDTGLTRTDSLSVIALRDSFQAAKAHFGAIYKRFPATADSLCEFPRVGVHRIYGSDGSGISEVLRLTPTMISVPLSLSTHMNRALLYGIPVPLGGITTTYGSSALEFGSVRGTDALCATQVSSIDPTMSEGIRAEYHPLPVVSPEMMILWENGVFDENILDLRFCRPITGNTHLGLFSNYRHFARRTYSHDYSNVYGFYSDLVDDTTILSNRGVNPLVNEHHTGVRLLWHGAEGEEAHVTYRYIDAQNDMAVQNRQQVREKGWGSIELDRYAQWGNDFKTGVSGVGIGPLRLLAELSVESGGHKVSPFSRETPPSGGIRKSFDASVRPGLCMPRDTAYLSYTFSRTDKLLYTGDKWESNLNTIVGGYSRGFGTEPVSGRVEAEVGQQFLKADSLLANLWIGHGGLTLRGWDQEVRLFGGVDAMPYEIPFDPVQQIAGELLDRYYYTGVESFFHVRLAGLMLAYCFVPRIDSSSAHHAWPGGVPPYEAPRSVITLAPVFGRIGGLALTTRWMISDTKPRLKAQAALSYEAHVRDNRAHLRADLVFDYWSKREAVQFGDTLLWDQWGREIYDLSLKTSVQIGTFRLFYKIDNLLNRRIAYLPGYFLPGICFRWGFNWLIQG